MKYHKRLTHKDQDDHIIVHLNGGRKEVKSEHGLMCQVRLHNITLIFRGNAIWGAICEPTTLDHWLQQAHFEAIDAIANGTTYEERILKLNGFEKI